MCSWHSTSTCACTIKAGIQRCRGETAGARGRPLRSRTRASPARRPEHSRHHPREGGTGRQEHAALTSGRGRGDCCRAGSGTCPQLANFSPASAQALHRLDTSYGAAHGVGMPKALPACTFPHAAFFSRGSTSKGTAPLSLATAPCVQQVLSGGQHKARTSTRPCSTAPPAPGSKPQSDRPARKTESSVL